MSHNDWGKPAKVLHLQEEEIRRELASMETDPSLDTRVSLVKEVDSTVHLITFQEKHLQYLRQHPKTNPTPYLTNLKTMLKIRSGR